VAEKEARAGRAVLEETAMFDEFLKETIATPARHQAVCLSLDLHEIALSWI